jgi:hypothetical protein
MTLRQLSCSWGRFAAQRRIEESRCGDMSEIFGGWREHLLVAIIAGVFIFS